jgi:hypothetical protein
MISADDEMGTPVIFPNQRMKNSFSRAGIAHGRRKDRQDDTIFGIIPFQKHLVTAQPGFRGNVILLRLTN